MDMDTWQKALACLSSELPGLEPSLSKLAWGGQPPRATTCPQQKSTDDGILLLQGRNELPTKNFVCSHTYLEVLEVL